jgi:hypothetical protein
MRHCRAISGCRPTFDRPRSVLAEKLERRTLMSVNVLTYHNDAGRTGQNLQETILTTSNVNSSSFQKLFSYPVDGQIYGQPLYVSDLAIPGKGIHNVVLVVTEHDSVYAFEADSNAGAGGGVLWHDSLGISAATPNSDFGNRYGPYHDINPEVGITSTPVVDLATDTMYVDAFTHDGAGLYSHHIHALDITTGAEKFGGPVLVAASVPGNGAGSVNGRIAFDAKQQLQRPALTLLNGVLYVSYSGYADTDPYHGWIIGFDASNLHPLAAAVFNDTPNGSEGGIWMGGNGLAADAAGNLYLEIGNGDFSAASSNYGESFVKLSTASGLSVSDYFTPFNQAQLSGMDRDLGSGGPILLPQQPGSHPNEMIGAGKEGRIYVVNRDNLGQYDPASDHVIQELPGAIGGGGSYDTPAYFNGSIYYSGSGDVTRAFSLTNGMLSTSPTSRSAATFGFPGSTPSISANGTSNGILWEIQMGNPAVLYAYDATNLAHLLYASNQAGARDQLGAGVKFAVPTIANGHVYVGTSNALAIFGLTPLATVPAAVSGLSILPPASSFQLSLSWSPTAGASAYKILRRTDSAGSYTQVGQVPWNLTSFMDTGLATHTGYSYEVVATDAVGDAGPSNAATGTTLYAGDANADGLVNFSDLLILGQHYGSQNASFATGDFNGDGVVDFKDLLILAQNYGAGTATAGLSLTALRKLRHTRL